MITPEQFAIEADRKAFAQAGSLHQFCKRAWPLVEPGQPFVDGWHIGAICEHLEAVSTVQIRNLVINIPPSCMKSRTVNVFWPVWEWISRPATRFFGVSFDEGLTLRDARYSLKILQSEWYRERWGLTCSLPAVVAEGDYKNLQGGHRFATSVRGRLTGNHADIVTIDDPIKPLTVSKTTLEECERWFNGTLPTRFRDPKTGRKVIIMQRLHESDMAGLAINAGFEVLRLPMEYEPKACSYTSLGGDTRTEPGQLLWPERFGPAEVEALKTTLGPRESAAQLQQRPAPESGALFNREWLKFWSKDPGTGFRILPLKFDKMLQSWDCTFKATDDSDYVCGQVWGKKGPDYYLLYMLLQRMGFADTCAAIRRVSTDWPLALTKLIEDKANGSAVIETLQKEISGIVAVNPEGGKVARANAVSPFHAAGNVFYPHPSTAPWVAEHVESMARFPFAPHDDDVDAETQALLYLHTHTSNLAQAMAALKAQPGGMVGFFRK